MSNRPIHAVSPAEAAAWLERDDAVLVDVREPHEFASEHVQEARSIPLGQFVADVQSAGLPAGRRVIVMCLSGGRSSRACAALASQLPDQEVYNLEGGIMGWKNAGLPVVSGPAGAGFLRSLWRR